LTTGSTLLSIPWFFEAASCFLKGVSGVETPENTWSLLSVNFQAIGMFFDCLILNDKIPVFNYGDTFDMQLNFDQRVLTRINDYQEVLYDVDVEFGSYHQVKSAAVAELKKVYEGPQRIQQSMVNEISSELSTAEYRWKPNLGELEYKLKVDDEKQLAAFLLGALIFGGYAQQMESEHLLQPKRSRILLALALHAKSTRYRFEDVIFAELRAKANTLSEELPWQPTFFPYLLARANSPAEVLQEVVKLRKSKSVAEYRHWLQETMQDWKKNGRINVKKKRRTKNCTKYRSDARNYSIDPKGRSQGNDSRCYCSETSRWY
jgi:hypothetical protein